MMKKLLIFLSLLVLCFSQQINYDWGYTTAGVAYTQTGYSDADSSTTISIVFDMQDYYMYDWYPLIVNDILTVTGSSSDTVGVDSIYGATTATVYNNSTRHYIGTFWLRIDAQNATDSIGYALKVYPGNFVYHPNDDSRITTSNINFSTTATTIVDTSTTKAVNDVQWTPYNIYLNFTAGKFLPSEFIKATITFQNNAADSMDVYWNYAYLALIEETQSKRHTTRSKGESRKTEETLH